MLKFVEMAKKRRGSKLYIELDLVIYVFHPFDNMATPRSWILQGPLRKQGWYTRPSACLSRSVKSKILGKIILAACCVTGNTRIGKISCLSNDFLVRSALACHCQSGVPMLGYFIAATYDFQK